MRLVCLIYVLSLVHGGLDEDVDQFLKLGYIVVKNAFTREKAAEWTKDIWHRLNLDPDNKAGWDRERIHMPSRSREKVADFAPKVKKKFRPNGVDFIFSILGSSCSIK